MASVNEQVEIAASPEQVWAVIADPARSAEWIDNHQGFVGEPPAGYEEGTTFGQRIRVMNMPADVRWSVEEYQAPSVLRMKGSGPMGIGLKAAYEVAPSGAGSQVTVGFDFSGGAVFAVAGQLTREVGDSLRVSLGKLKAIAEG